MILDAYGRPAPPAQPLGFKPTPKPKESKGDLK